MERRKYIDGTWYIGWIGQGIDVNEGHDWICVLCTLYDGVAASIGFD